MSNKKGVTAEKIIEALDKYRELLHKDPKVSATKFQHMQTALFGAKQLVRDLYGIARISEMAWVK